MHILKKILKSFIKEDIPVKESHERELRELLRENLKTISVDVFHYDDPIVKLSPEERKTYLSYFYTLVNDKKAIERIIYFINKQANITLKNSKDSGMDAIGTMRLDGMNMVKDDFERLAGMFLKEESQGNGNFDKNGL